MERSTILPSPCHFGGSRPPRQGGLWGGVSWGNGAERVLEALKGNPTLAQDIKSLCLTIWVAEGLGLVLGELLESFQAWFLAHASTPELITRERRRILAEGLVQLSPKAEAERQAREEAWRTRYGRGRG